MAKKNPPVNDTIDENVVEQYNKVVSSAELMSVQLVHIDFDVSPRYFSIDSDACDIGYVVNTEATMFNEEDGLAVCLVNFDVEAKDAEGAALECNAKYTIAYNVDQSCEKEAVEKFLNRVGVFACYPYFRGLFASLDWSANTRLPPLPIHRENLATRPKKKSAKRVKERIEKA